MHMPYGTCVCRLTVLCRAAVHWHKPFIVQGLLCRGKTSRLGTIDAHYNNVQHCVSSKLVSHHFHAQPGTHSEQSLEQLFLINRNY